MTLPEKRIRPAGNGTDSQSPATTTEPSIARDTDVLDYSHAGHLSGYDRGFAHGQRFADEDRAQAILHAYATKMAGLAVRTARAHWGEGWASLIERQASGVDW